MINILLIYKVEQFDLASIDALCACVGQRFPLKFETNKINFPLPTRPFFSQFYQKQIIRSGRATISRK